MMAGSLTHISGSGEARMVDVGGKAVSRREAVAISRVRMQAETLRTILRGNAHKGDVLSAARLAGIMAAKKTPDLIPLCHPVGLSAVQIEIDADEALPGLVVTSTARCTGTTGVEMEALTAASIACLTIYDMGKSLDRGMVIEQIRLIAKSGGKSGDWRAETSDN